MAHFPTLLRAVPKPTESGYFDLDKVKDRNPRAASYVPQLWAVANNGNQQRDRSTFSTILYMLLRRECEDLSNQSKLSGN